MDWQKLESTISEKFKYLFISKFTKSYDLISLSFEISDAPQGLIMEYDVAFKTDYNGSNNGDTQSIWIMLSKIEDDLYTFLHEYPINPKTYRFDKNVQKEFNYSIGSALVLKIDYDLDASHKTEMLFRVTYEHK